MALNVYRLFEARNQPTKRDWSNQDIAEFYRVEAALLRAGMRVSTGRGLSDEGDPWFVFCKEPDGDVLVHFARIDGDYIVVAAPTEQIIRGQDFRQVINQFADQHPVLMVAAPRTEGAKVFMHPAALLAAIVATLFFQSSTSDAVAAEIDPGAGESLLPADMSPAFRLSSSSSDSKTDDVASQRQLAMIISSMIVAAGLHLAIEAQTHDPRLMDLPELETTTVQAVLSIRDEVGSTEEDLSGAARARRAQEARSEPVAGDWAAKESTATEGSSPPTAIAQLFDDTALAQQVAFLDSVNVGGSFVQSQNTAETSGFWYQNAEVGPHTLLEQSENGVTAQGALSSYFEALSALVDDDASQGLRAAILEVIEAGLQIDMLVMNSFSELSAAWQFSAAANVLSYIEQAISGESETVVILPEQIVETTPDVEVIPQDETSTVTPVSDGTVNPYDADAALLIQMVLDFSDTIDLVSINGIAVFVEMDESRYDDTGFSIRTWTFEDGSTISLIGVVPPEAMALI